MTTSFSPLLRLAIQGTGDNPSTWGQVANGQVFLLTENAISGYLVLDCTGSSDITLTVGNGVSDQSRNAMIELTGFPTADINIIIPTITKKYIIRTTYTGTNNITIKPTGGTGVTFQSGQNHLIFCDGLNVYEVKQNLGALAQLNTITSAGLLDTGVVTASAIATSTITQDKLAFSLPQAFPVGSLYFNADSSTNPATLLGYGVWVSYGGGRVPIGIGTGTDINGRTLTVAASATGGEYSHTQTSLELYPHLHHSGIPHIDSGQFGSDSGFNNVRVAGFGSAPFSTNSTRTDTVGQGQPFNVTQPWVGVYIWRRTA